MNVKSESFEPKKLPGEKPVPSILIDADKILELLLRAEPMMNKTDRRRYLDRAVNAILDVIDCFTMAYDLEDEREIHLRRLFSATNRFIHIARVIGAVNAIRIHPEYETMSPHQLSVELVERIASLDEGVTKWRKSIIRKKDKDKD